jgi:hypothetical protein
MLMDVATEVRWELFSVRVLWVDKMAKCECGMA